MSTNDEDFDENKKRLKNGKKRKVKKRKKENRKRVKKIGGFDVVEKRIGGYEKQKKTI